MTTLRDLAQLIDHSLLHPALTDAEILEGCAVARHYGVKAVCVKPCAVAMVKEAMRASPVLVCTVVGFPHGSSMTAVKVRETLEALNAGAQEIDMVVNIGKVLGGEYGYVKEEIREVARICRRPGGVLKVIFENDFLQPEHIVELCRICAGINVDYIKTSTGFGFVKQPGGQYDYAGATEAHVRLMSLHAQQVRIKSSGGIRTLDQCLNFAALGCSRLGTSATAAIMQEAQQRGWK